MADSLRELIMQDLHTSLQAVTVENGYAHTLTAVERLLQRGQSSQPPMAYLLEGDDDITTEGPNHLVTRTLSVGVVLVVRQDESEDARSASEVMNALIADCQKAIQQDPQRGGSAIDTNEQSISAVQIEEGMPELSCTLAYRINYRHRRDDATVAV